MSPLILILLPSHLLSQHAALEMHTPEVGGGISSQPASVLTKCEYPAEDILLAMIFQVTHHKNPAPNKKLN